MTAARLVLRRIRLPGPIALPRPGRRLVLGGLGALVLLAGGWMWLRDSSLVAVERVTITGLRGHDAPQVREALTTAAADMTTLHVRADELRDAVVRYPVVKDLRVDAGPPHALRIIVIARMPVGIVTAGGRRVAVAGDGTVLGPALDAALPAIGLPSRTISGRLVGARPLAALAVLAAAPDALRDRATRISQGPRGLTLALRDGPLLYFGSGARAAAKWAAAAAVLADASSAGARYVDVRVPERVVAGGLPAAAADPAEAQGDGSIAPTTGATAPTPAPTASAPGAPAPAAGGATVAPVAPVAPGGSAPATSAPAPAPAGGTAAPPANGAQGAAPSAPTGGATAAPTNPQP